MRPHLLKMKAFGPFADATTVDFDSMGNNVYLIAGDTGAGKTTIFDAMVYALYGVASGTERSRLGAESFHSDFAKHGSARDDMEVELTFSNAGKQYRVLRNVSWGKKGTNVNASKRSILWEGTTLVADGNSLKQNDAVTERIRDILGLDPDQFRRIIMLAQGEFRKFLTADSGEREEILGRLYDNGRHRDLQLRLHAAQKLLEKEDRRLYETEKFRVESLALPEELSEEERDCLKPGHTGLTAALTAIIDRMTAAAAEVEIEIEQSERQRSALEQKFNDARQINEDFERLNEAWKQLEALETGAAEREQTREQIARAEAALTVRPNEQMRDDAEKKWKQAAGNIPKLEQRLKELEVERERQKADAKETEETNRPKIEKETQRANLLGESLPRYRELAASLEAQKAARESRTAAEGAVQNCEKARNDLKAQLDTAEQKLQQLEHAGKAAVENAQKELEARKERCVRLEKLKEALKECAGLQKTVTEREKSLREKQIAEITAWDSCSSLRRRFLEGQAGVLAAELRRQLQTEPSVTCPVCGAVHRAEDEAHFARTSGNVPEKTEVDAAEQFYHRVRDEKEEADRALTGARKDLENAQKTVSELAKELLDDSGETAVSEAGVDSAIRQCKAQVGEAEAALRKAQRESREREQTLLNRDALKPRLTAAEQALEQANTALSEAGSLAAAAETSVSEKRSRLEGFPKNEAEASREKQGAELRAKTLQKEIDEANDRAQKTDKQLAETTAGLSTERRHEAERKQELALRTQALKEAIADKGFADAEDYHAALAPVGERPEDEAVERWIKTRKQLLEQAEKEKNQFIGAIRELEARTAEKKPVDLSGLSAELEELKLRLAALRSKDKQLNADLKTDRNAQKELAAIRTKRSANEKLHGYLDPMANCANSKLPFSRYVLTDFFRRVIRRADDHLAIMTGGEYRLEEKENTDGRQLAGLNLQVINEVTNTPRNIASLSGGQTFETSLALALGLSEVVQMDSTSVVQIESMFIDEGFGSLDSARLDKALRVLMGLSDGKRQIGIISHVEQLECLPNKIHVKATATGSRISYSRET